MLRGFERYSAARGSGLTNAPFIATVAVCLGLFTWMLTYGTGRLLANDVFANFYDYQAEAWLHGRWDVPESVLSGEAFVVNGRVYGYFGPTPALMRLPFIVTGVGVGRLTRVFMLIDYAACLFGAYAVIRHAWRIGTVRGPRQTEDRPPSEAGEIDRDKSSAQSRGTQPPAWFTVVVVLGTGLGSTLFFLGSRPYVYHEAIVCGAAFALWGVWCTLRYMEQPASRWWIGAVTCGILAVHARPPIGLFALTFVGAVALWNTVQQRRLAPLCVAIAAALGIASFNALSYLKFGTFEGCPLRLNVQYTPEKIAKLGNANFNLGNLRFNSDSYLLLPSASIQPRFPYIFLKYLDRTRYPESRMAYRDPTLALPYSTPGLVFLAFAGTAVAFATRNRLRVVLALLWLSAVPLTLAMVTAVAVTNRYTADFAPFLITTAVVAGSAVLSRGAAVRRVVATSAAILTAIAATVQFATTLHNQRAVVWGTPPGVQEEYQLWQHRIDAFFRGQTGH